MRFKYVLSFFGWLVEIVFLSFAAFQLLARGRWGAGSAAAVSALAGVAVTLFIVRQVYCQKRS